MAIKKKLGRVEQAILMRNIRQARQRELEAAARLQADEVIKAMVERDYAKRAEEIRQRILDEHARKWYNRLISLLKKKMGR